MILGIDPGLSGAWALLDRAGTVLGCDDLPVIRDHGTAWIDGPQLHDHVRQAIPSGSFQRIDAYIERVHSMPKQGVVSSFTFGLSFGSVLAGVQLLDASIRLVGAPEWKKSAGLSKDKHASRDRARLLFPTVRLNRVKDHNLAEALLIAHYGLQQQPAAGRVVDFEVAARRA
jgi:crossover junction endodeoxyribonuclease RuvC